MGDPKLVYGSTFHIFLSNTYFQEDAAEAYQNLENKAVTEKTCFLWWCWDEKPDWAARNNIAFLVNNIARCRIERTPIQLRTPSVFAVTKDVIEYVDNLISAQSDGSGGYSFDEVEAARSVFDEENPQCLWGPAENAFMGGGFKSRR